jgi:hypothetical protein
MKREAAELRQFFAKLWKFHHSVWRHNGAKF